MTQIDQVEPARQHRRCLFPGIVLAAALFLALPTVASAHLEIVATSPSGAARTTLKLVTVTFSGPIRSGTLKVFGPSGEKASKRSGGRDPHNFSRVRAAMKSNLSPGRYTANVRWVGADGHHQRASFSFRLQR